MFTFDIELNLAILFLNVGSGVFLATGVAVRAAKEAVRSGKTTEEDVILDEGRFNREAERVTIRLRKDIMYLMEGGE